MPSEHGQVVTASHQDIATLPLNQAIDAYAPSFAAVLPANVSLDHFKRMVVTAINTNPELAAADRRSLFNACIKCASDGLLPDGREAALVVFNTKIKHKVGNAWQEEWIKLAQFMPMIAGIRKRMRNSGEVVSAVAEVVYENDKFRYAKGDSAFIEHEPAPLGAPQGKPVGAYAIIRLKSGEVLRDVMPKAEIEAARSKSRAKDSLMWTDFWGEGAKKTVLRRCAKAAPQSAGMESLLGRDEELPELPAFAELAPPEPEPPRGRELTHVPEPEPEPQYDVTDCDGEMMSYHNERDAADALDRVFADAQRRGQSHVEAVHENNAGLIAQIGLPHTHSPASTEQQLERKDIRSNDGAGSALHAAPQQSSPAGEPISDLLGGEARPAVKRFNLPRNPGPRDFQAFADWIDVELADGVSGPTLRSHNEDALRRLKAADQEKYEAVQERLTL